MKKMTLFPVSVSAAVICAAVPASFNGSPARFSLDTAEARVGRPLTATSVAGVSRRVHRREYRRAAGAAVAAGAVAAGAAAAAPAPVVTAPGPVVAVPAPAPVVAAGPVVAAPAPYGGPGYGYGPGPYPDTVVVNPVTGRWCRTEWNGYQFCWTP
jgi:cell pole-organizing protein PopZ